jgi:hypothetical protein
MVFYQGKVGSCLIRLLQCRRVLIFHTHVWPNVVIRALSLPCSLERHPSARPRLGDLEPAVGLRWAADP